MQELRRADGIWDLDEPFHNDEVDTFRIFMLWKVGNWQSLTQVRPPAAYLPLYGPNTRITIDQTLINAGRRDANQFQPVLPVPPAKKTKDLAKGKDKPIIGFPNQQQIRSRRVKSNRKRRSRLI